MIIRLRTMCLVQKLKMEDNGAIYESKEKMDFCVEAITLLNSHSGDTTSLHFPPQ